ncbi:class II poly(R)-hydroxyalkanoic acid synthase [Pseudomonas neustonica]|uniref:Class II poly(R)-hydroxyalkanoic acid synthase n=1 Tax=Pseudomonas neustonica TaxID=2487346 RepID=A0ABX9XG76_9PSED|nr:MULTISPECIES: class II poly(R)-hydroxyalkanoic acid synthase [Pseudomonas]MBA6419180.1 class II poly(R)-hydroxyalkanoic acid synthase [Pseudomonas sp. 5Ae-yellow]ROZ81646.1 class II poly(R)-hydroxyalkanoic acid synthase [Pseudomonas sp. SSM44]ROZ83360.1 class II poly(R)-hydroxyalkanoic acid synthase [Pseudomonas neustonica]|tara:strand:+ start:2392 stop:4071 length:1680 start_codon:yes stop_codon:yes gene_type:complete
MGNKINDDLSQKTSESILGPNPVIGVPTRDLISTARMVMRQTVKQPVHSLKHIGRLGLAVKDVMIGRSEIAPAPEDRRFADPTWNQNPVYRRYMQTYLAWRKELNTWISTADLAEQDVSRAQFVIALMTEAMSPTNTALNPAALKRFFETGGKSLLDGLTHLAQDIAHNGGMPSQVNMNAFEVGGNLAITKGSVVFRNEVLELIQYKPLTEEVYERPVLVVPPQINKFYVFDLSPEKSLARYLSVSHMQTFVVSWRNPTKAHREWGLSTYIEALKEAIDVILKITGSKDVSMLGACSGGITTVSLLGHYAALKEKKVHSFTLLVSVLDTQIKTQVALFADERSIEAARRMSYQHGVLEGRDMAKIFAWMRPNDLVWNYWVNNYLLGNEPPVFDILFWNNDTTRLPAALHGEFLEMFKSNPLTRPGALEVCGTPIDLKQVKSDYYVIAGLNDHITPWEACFKSAQLLGGKCEFVLSSSGHIQSILNPPGNPKARFFTNSEMSDDSKKWLETATKQSDSWWQHWRDWLHARGGKRKAAPAILGNDEYPALEPAPGTYVHER